MLQKVLISAGVLSILAMVSVFAPVQAAQRTIEIVIPDGTIVRESAGSTTELETVSVDQDMVGMVCDVEATALNQELPSEHPGNNLVVASGSTSVTLENVEPDHENDDDGITTAEGTLALGQNITVTLDMGPDEVFSGGLNVTVTCEEPEPTTVSANADFNDACGVEDDMFSVEETEGVSYDVDDQRVDGVGSVTVTATADNGYELEGETTFSGEFTNEPCEVPTEEVCRDGEIITINPDERQDSDTDTCPQALGEQAPTQIANTGVGAVAASIAGSTSILAGVRSWAKSRSQMKDVLSNR